MCAFPDAKQVLVSHEQLQSLAPHASQEGRKEESNLGLVGQNSTLAARKSKYCTDGLSL